MCTTDEWLSFLSNELSGNILGVSVLYTWYVDSSGEKRRSGLHIPVVPGKLIKHSFREAV